MPGMSIGELVATYVQAAEASADFDKPRLQNAAANCVASVYRQLRSRGLESQRALLPLLAHPSLKVRQWAAAHALQFAPEAGVPVLSEMAKDKVSLYGFEAEITLREWRAGRLRFP